MNHKNVLKLNYIKENMNYIFLIMDLMQGGSLKDLIVERYISKERFFNEEEIALIIKNILEGLKYLNSIKVLDEFLDLADVHRGQVPWLVSRHAAARRASS